MHVTTMKTKYGPMGDHKKQPDSIHPGFGGKNKDIIRKSTKIKKTRTKQGLRRKPKLKRTKNGRRRVRDRC